MIPDYLFLNRLKSSMSCRLKLSTTSLFRGKFVNGGLTYFNIPCVCVKVLLCENCMQKFTEPEPKPERTS